MKAHALLRAGMQLANPHPECTVEQVGEYIRAHVGGGNISQVQACYRTVASLALQHKFRRVLIVGESGEAHAHLSARDAVAALAEIGVPSGFRLAFVPTTDETRNGHRHAEMEARTRGLRARVFDAEHEAVAWLTEPELH
jgi:hypothetical protein